MEILKSIFDYISGLGNYVMIPIMITLVGLIARLSFGKALKSGMTVGIGLIGMDMILNLLWTYISPVADIFVKKSNLNLEVVDIGWSADAGLAFSTIIGSFIIPFIIVVNVVLLMLKVTKTINIDIWNYWHYAFSGAVVFMATGSYAYSFLAAAVHCTIALVIADKTANLVQKTLGIPGISIPQGFAVTSVPIFASLEKIYDLIKLPKGSGEKEPEILTKNKWLKTVADPIFLGAIIGIGLGVGAGYEINKSLTCGMAMAALMYLLPRMVKVIMEGLLPISNQTREYMQKKFNSKEFYIGMDSAILLGVPTTIQVALLLIPITLLLAMILPYNKTLPVGDLAATAYFVSMASLIHKKSFLRTLISGTIMMGLVLLVATFFAPILTNFAVTGSLEIPEGALQVTAMSAGNWFAYIMYQLTQLGLIGALILLGLSVLVVVGIKKLANVKEKSL